jgi:hypothetical protein
MGQEERGKLGREVGVVEKVASEVAEVWWIKCMMSSRVRQMADTEYWHFSFLKRPWRS